MLQICQGIPIPSPKTLNPRPFTNLGYYFIIFLINYLFIFR